MAKTPDGKVILYSYVKPKTKKFIQLQAVKQDVSTSDYVEACLARAMEDPPVISARGPETRGRKKKIRPPETFAETQVDSAEVDAP